jgi:hypothetical protein
MVMNMDARASVDLTAKRKIYVPDESRAQIVKPITSHSVRHARLIYSIEGTSSIKIFLIILI